MRKLHIVAPGFADDRYRPNIGGVESYIQLLSSALSPEYEIVVYQPSISSFDQLICGVHVIGLGPHRLSAIVRTIEATRLVAGDILLFATDQYCCGTSWPATAVIQHGVSWDLQTDLLTSRSLAFACEKAYRVFLSLRNHRRIRTFHNIICVDFNYLNWYRTLATKQERTKRFICIPNCAGPHFEPSPVVDPGSVVNVCFARRLTRLRGTRLFREIAQKLLSTHSNVTITVAGSGSSAELAAFQSLASADRRVSLVSPTYLEMPAVYRQSSIVVIPSLGSEGTSLSAIEAMAVGRAVVASNVGGLTNLILDGFNGFLVEPTTQAFCDLLSSLIRQPETIARIATAAQSVAARCHGFETWKQRWRDALAGIGHAAM